jgi:hypothetical protein
MTDDPNLRYREPGPTRSSWTRSSWTRSSVAALLFAVIWSATLAFLAVRLQTVAASECDRFAAADRLLALFFVWPGLSLGMWAAFTVAVVMLGRQNLRAAFATGLVVTLVIAYWFVAGTPALIREMPEATSVPCPGGVPAWWPGWLPS